MLILHICYSVVFECSVITLLCATTCNNLMPRHYVVAAATTICV